MMLFKTGGISGRIVYLQSLPSDMDIIYWDVNDRAGFALLSPWNASYISPSKVHEEVQNQPIFPHSTRSEVKVSQWLLSYVYG